MGLTRIRAEQISDIDYKQAVRVITLENVTLAGGAPAVVDGVSLTTGNRILVAGQSNAAENGLYQVQILGTGADGTWTRTSDANQDGEIQPGMTVMVTEGTEYADTPWKLVTNGIIVIGETELIFAENYSLAFGNVFANGTAVVANVVSAGLTLTAGDNISITGNNTTKSITIGVTGISLNSIANGDSNVDIAVANADVTVSVAGTTNVAVFGNDRLTVAGNVLPAANVTYDLGAPAQRWNDIYLSNSTIYLGNAQISANATSLILTNPEGAQTVFSGPVANIIAGTVTATGNITGGNVNTAGQVVAIGNITASNIITAGNVDAANVNTTAGIAAGTTIVATGNVSGGNLTTAGNIDGANVNVTAGITAGTTVIATGNVSGGNITTTGEVVATGNVAGGNITTGGTIVAIGNIAGGNISAGSGIISTAGNVDGANVNATANITGTGAVFSGNVTADTFVGNIIGNISAGGANTNIQFNDDGILNGSAAFTFDKASNAAVVTGNIIGDNLNTAGQVVATGNVSGGNITTAGEVVATGNVTGGNLLGTLITGTMLTAVQPNITSVGTLTSLAVIGNTTSGNFVGILNGSGANVTAIDATNISSGTLAQARLANANVVLGNTTLTLGTTTATIDGLTSVTSTTFVGDLTGAATTAGTVTTAAQPNITSVGTLTSLITSGNAVIGGNLTVNGNVVYVNITDLNVQDPIIGLGRGANDTPLTSNDGKDRGEQLWYYTTSEKSAFIGFDNSANKLMAALDVTIANEIVTVNSFGNFVAGGLEAATAEFTGNVTTGNVSGTVGTFTTVLATSNVAGGNITTAGEVVATGNVVGGNIDTAGQIVATGNITGNFFLGNGSQLTGIDATSIQNGTANVRTFLNGNVSISAASVANVAVFTSTGANVTGTLNVTGNASAGNLDTLGLIVATGNITGGNLDTAGQVVATGNVSGGNLIAAGAVAGNGRALTSLNATNLDEGTVSSARLSGTYTITVSGSATTAGTVTTAAQPNITSVGTLTSVIVTGNVVGGNIDTAGQIVATGNITGGNILGNGAGLSGINVFSNVTIDGGNSIVADSISDTLTLIAGSGIALIGNAAADTITIALTGAGDSIFVTGGDMGTVEEEVTQQQDLGDVDEAAIAEIDMGTIVTSGVLYPDQLVLPSYTVAELGNLSATPAAQFVFCTDDAGGAVPAFSDGVNWRRVTDRAVVS